MPLKSSQTNKGKDMMQMTIEMKVEQNSSYPKDTKIHSSAVPVQLLGMGSPGPTSGQTALKKGLP